MEPCHLAMHSALVVIFVLGVLQATTALARIGDTLEQCKERYEGLTLCPPTQAEFVLEPTDSSYDDTQVLALDFDEYGDSDFKFISGLAASNRGPLVRSAESYSAEVGNYIVYLRFIDNICHFIGYKKKSFGFQDNEVLALVEKNFGPDSLKDKDSIPSSRWFFNEGAELNNKLSGNPVRQETTIGEKSDSEQQSSIEQMIQQCEEALSSAIAAGNIEGAQRWKLTIQQLKEGQTDQQFKFSSEVKKTEALANYNPHRDTLVLYSRKMFNLMKVEHEQTQEATKLEKQNSLGEEGLDRL